MHGPARWSWASFLAVSLACLACRAQEEGAGGKESERAAALREATQALRTVVQTQTAAISRLEEVLKAPPPDLKALQEAAVKKLQDEAANPNTSEARRRQILEVEIPEEKNEGKANEENLKKLKQQRDRAVADRKAVQDKLAELQTQLDQCADAKAESGAAPKAEPKPQTGAEVKAAP
jgi:hypothetical protein